MSRDRKISRWTGAALLVAAVGAGAAGCVAVPVGGYGYGGADVALPAPGVVIAPPPIVFGGGHYGHYGHRYRYGRGWGYRGHRGWR